MYSYTGLPSVNVHDVAQKITRGDPFILLDVREGQELRLANLGQWATHAPLSALAEFGLEALPESVMADRETEIVVMCHHGIRSAQVTAWLKQQGWTRVYNMTGGIEAYATAVDPTVGHY